jgi:peroxiredoxin
MNVGDKIPEILGIDQDGREIKASDYRGRKIVLYSYPKANTSGCTAEACSLQAHKEELAAAGYEIIGVSKDKQALQKKFAETKGLQFISIFRLQNLYTNTLQNCQFSLALKKPFRKEISRFLLP